MQITISWTILIVALSAYLLCRYLFFSYMKWYRGFPDAFDPFVSISESSADLAWREGYHQGKLEGKAKIKLKRLIKKRSKISGQLQGNHFKDIPENDIVT